MKSSCYRIHILPCVAMVAMLGVCPARADELRNERFRMKSIAKTVAAEIEKNYYDPNLKGLNWNGLLEQAQQKIDNAKNVREIPVGIFVMVDKLKDSHTHFLPPSVNVKLKYGFEAKPFGDDIRIYKIMPNQAAEHAGLKVGDKIVSLNGHGAERFSFDDMLLYYRVLHPLLAWELVVQTGKEKPRSVHLEAKREDKPIVLDIDRLSDFWDIILEEQSETEEERTYHTANYDGGIGYIQVREFPGNASFLDGLADKVKDSKAIVIDLAGGPAGLGDTFKNVAGHFVSDATILNKAVGRKKTEEVVAKPKKPYFSGPLFVLIDSRTGSAGEAFSGFFQSQKKAVVVGDASLGRLMTARYFPEEFGAEKIVYYGIQISTAKVVLPSGDEIEGKGVTPDVPCNPTGDDLREGHDVCLNLAMAKAREALHLPPSEKQIIHLDSSKN